MPDVTQNTKKVPFFWAKHHSKNNGGTEEGLWADLSHFYYLGISNSWRAAPQLSI